MHSPSPPQLHDILVLLKSVEQYAESGISTDCDIAAMVRRNSSMLNHISSLLSLEERGLGTRLFTPITSSSPPPPPSRSSFFSSFASSPPLSTAGCTSLQCSACIWRRAIQRGEVTDKLCSSSPPPDLLHHPCSPSSGGQSAVTTAI